MDSIEPSEVLSSDLTSHWAKGLRDHDEYNEKMERVLLSDGSERYNAAKALQNDRDKRCGNVLRHLKKCEQVEKEYIKSTAMRKTNIQQSSVPQQKIDFFEDEQNLRSKKEMLEETGFLPPKDVKPPLPISQPMNREDSVGTRSKALWSRKSVELYGLLSTIVESDKTVDFGAPNLLKTGACVGIVNTYSVDPTCPTRLDRIFSSWSYFKRAFTINRDALLPVEFESQIVEPLLAAAASEAAARPPRSTLSRSTRRRLFNDNVTAISHDPVNSGAAEAFERAISGREASHEQERAISRALSSSQPIRAVLKARTVNGETHLRPLCTGGDLLLALNELLDPTLFETGYIQIPDPPRFVTRKGKLVMARDHYTSPPRGADRLFYRLLYRKYAGEKWIRISLKSSRLTKGLKDFVCPHVCNKAFEFKEIDSCDVTDDMKRISYSLLTALTMKTPGKPDIPIEELTVDFEVVYPAPNTQEHDVASMANILARESANVQDISVLADPELILAAQEENTVNTVVRDPDSAEAQGVDSKSRDEKIPGNSSSNFQLRVVHIVDIRYKEMGKRRFSEIFAVARTKGIVASMAQKFKANVTPKRMTPENELGTLYSDSTLDLEQVLSPNKYPHDIAEVLPSEVRLGHEPDARRSSTQKIDTDEVMNTSSSFESNNCDAPVLDNLSAENLSNRSPTQEVAPPRAQVDLNFSKSLERRHSNVPTFDIAPGKSVSKEDGVDSEKRVVSKQMSMSLEERQMAMRARIVALWKSGKKAEKKSTELESRAMIIDRMKYKPSLREQTIEKRKPVKNSPVEMRRKSKFIVGVNNNATPSKFADDSEDMQKSATLKVNAKVEQRASSPKEVLPSGDSTDIEESIVETKAPTSDIVEQCSQRPALKRFIAAVKTVIELKAHGKAVEIDVPVDENEGALNTEIVRRKMLIKAVVEKEMAATGPLNELLKKIDHSIARDDPYYIRSLMYDKLSPREEKQLTIHDVSTHNHLKESLYRSNNIRYSKNRGFVGPIEDIYRYAVSSSVMTKDTPAHAGRSKDRNEYQPYDPDNFSVHSEPSAISVDSVIRRHTHRRIVKTSKQQRNPENQTRRQSTVQLNPKHFSPSRHEVVQNISTEPTNEVESMEISKSTPPACKGVMVSGSTSPVRKGGSVALKETNFLRKSNKSNPFAAELVSPLKKRDSLSTSSSIASRAHIMDNQECDTGIVLKDTTALFSHVCNENGDDTETICSSRDHESDGSMSNKESDNNSHGGDDDDDSTAQEIACSVGSHVESDEDNSECEKHDELGPMVALEKRGGLQEDLNFIFDLMETGYAKRKNATTERGTDLTKRLAEQRREWALESEKILEAMVSRLHPDIGNEIRTGLWGRNRVTYRDSEASSISMESATSDESSDDSSSQVSIDSTFIYDECEVEKLKGEPIVNELIHQEADLNSLSEAGTSDTRNGNISSTAGAEVSARRSTDMSKKMAKAIALSDELQRRRTAERERLRKLRELENPKEKNLMDKLAHDEMHAQNRLMRKLTRKLVSLQTHIIDLANTAKLPYSAEGLPISRKKRTFKRKKKKVKSRRRNKRKIPNVGNDMNDSSIGDTEELVQGGSFSDSTAAQVRTGGKLWGNEYTSIATGYVGMGEFDTLWCGGKLEGSEYCTSSDHLANSFGLMEAMDEVLGMYSKEELYEMRSEIIGGTNAESSDAWWTTVGSADILSCVTEVVNNVISEAIKRLLEPSRCSAKINLMEDQDRDENNGVYNFSTKIDPTNSTMNVVSHQVPISTTMIESTAAENVEKREHMNVSESSTLDSTLRSNPDEGILDSSQKNHTSSTAEGISEMKISSANENVVSVPYTCKDICQSNVAIRKKSTRRGKKAVLRIPTGRAQTANASNRDSSPPERCKESNRKFASQVSPRAQTAVGPSSRPLVLAKTSFICPEKEPSSKLFPTRPRSQVASRYSQKTRFAADNSKRDSISAPSTASQTVHSLQGLRDTNQDESGGDSITESSNTSEKGHLDITPGTIGDDFNIRPVTAVDIVHTTQNNENSDASYSNDSKPNHSDSSGRNGLLVHGVASKAQCTRGNVWRGRFHAVYPSQSSHPKRVDTNKSGTPVEGPNIAVTPDTKNSLDKAFSYSTPEDWAGTGGGWQEYVMDTGHGRSRAQTPVFDASSRADYGNSIEVSASPFCPPPPSVTGTEIRMPSSLRSKIGRNKNTPNQLQSKLTSISSSDKTITSRTVGQSDCPRTLRDIYIANEAIRNQNNEDCTRSHSRNGTANQTHCPKNRNSSTSSTRPEVSQTHMPVTSIDQRDALDIPEREYVSSAVVKATMTPKPPSQRLVHKKKSPA